MSTENMAEEVFKLSSEFGWSDTELSKRVGYSRSAVASWKRTIQGEKSGSTPPVVVLKYMRLRKWMIGRLKDIMDEMPD